MVENDELMERRSRLKQMIGTLEWDKSHNQIHAGHSSKLSEYKKELAEIETKLKEGQ